MSNDYADAYDDDNYDYDYGDESQSGFAREVSNQFTAPAAKIMFRSLSEHQVIQRVMEIVRQVGSQIGYEHAEAECLSCLVAANFDVYKAAQIPFEESPLSKIIANGENNSKHYLVSWNDSRRGHLLTNDSVVDCYTCYEPLPVGQGRTFCTHFLCKDCWMMKLSVHRKEWSQSKMVLRCEDVKKPTCLGMTILTSNELDLQSFLGSAFTTEFFQKHNNLWCRSLADSSKFPTTTKLTATNSDGKQVDKTFAHTRFVPCGTEGCNHIFEVERDLYQDKNPEAVVGKCVECSKRTCFICHGKEHSPATCATMAMWIDKETDEGANAQWVLVHTKQCPKCQSMIEKNEGCNHMTCRKCKHEFCWICMGVWSEHGTNYYQCNKPKAESKEKAQSIEKARASLARYTHYYERFRNHMNSVKLDEKTMAIVSRYVNSNFGGENISYLEDVAKALFECRYTLANTYVYAYFETRDMDIFEFNQGRLEHATEELSRIVETCKRGGEIGSSQQEIQNKASVAKKYLEILRKGI